MGCDIHMIAEKRSKYKSEDAGWEPMLDAIFESRYFSKDEPISRYNIPYTFQPYEDRNYEVFSVLANVRNGYDIPPISDPRDYPDDMHEVSKWLLNGYDYVDHSHTWLSLEEVLDYDWAKAASNYHPGKTLKVSAERFLENMKILKRYAEQENCSIRLIFGFDS